MVSSGGEKDAPHRWHRMGQCPLVSGLMVTEKQEEAGAAGKQMGREQGSGVGGEAGRWAGAVPRGSFHRVRSGPLG